MHLHKVDVGMNKKSILIIMFYISVLIVIKNMNTKTH